MLKQADPGISCRDSSNNIKGSSEHWDTIIRQEEKISDHSLRLNGRRNHPIQFFYYVVNTDRAILYERIDRRVDQMIRDGLIEEVEISQGHGLHQTDGIHAGDLAIKRLWIIWMVCTALRRPSIF